MAEKNKTPPADPIRTPDSRVPLWDTLRQISRRQWLYLPRLFSQKEKIQILAVALIALSALAVLATRLGARVTVIQPSSGGILREGALKEPRFINPLYGSNDTDRDLINLVFSKLIRYDKNGALFMDLAENIDISPDGKIYTLRLRPNAEWHDGEKFSADDVIFTIKTIQDPEYKSPLKQNWQGVAVEKLNDSTVRFILRQPYAPFLENLAVGILPAHLWRKIPRETAILSDLNLKPVGTGPYKFTKFTRREDGTVTSVALSRNKRYYLPGPYLKEIRFTFYESEEKLAAAYRRNDIDSLAFLSRAGREELEGLDLNIHEFKLPKIFAVFLNSTVQPFLGSSAVRQALALGIDREALIAKTASGGGAAVNSIIPPGTFGFDADIAPRPYDPEQARKIFKDDKWKDSDNDGWLERTEGTGRNRKTQILEMRLATSDAPELASAAAMIAEMWQAIGVKTEVKILAISDLEASLIRPRAYEALLFGEVFGHDPDPFAFWHTSQLKDPGLNIALYSNRKADELLEEARRLSDPELRRSKYQELQKIVSDEIGAIFLYSPVQYYAVRKTIQGVELGAAILPEERFNQINQWYTETRRALK